MTEEKKTTDLGEVGDIDDPFPMEKKPKGRVSSGHLWTTPNVPPKLLHAET